MKAQFHQRKNNQKKDGSLILHNIPQASTNFPFLKYSPPIWHRLNFADEFFFCPETCKHEHRILPPCHENIQRRKKKLLRRDTNTRPKFQA